MDGVTLSPLKQINHPKGDILHAMKASDEGFSGFGEAYLSTVNKSDTKGWKKHNKMTLNLIVVMGVIEIVVHNGVDFFNTKLSKDNYQRLTIEPGLWVAFRGLSDKNILLNLANIEHNPSESISIELDAFEYNWNNS
jgi:dTDP-4-dehydrorhamnose 3,5-epimerase